MKKQRKTRKLRTEERKTRQLATYYSLTRRVTVLVMVFMLLSMTISTGTTSSIWSEKRKVTYTGGSKDIYVVWANLKDEKVRVDSVLADGKIGDVAWLENIVKSANDKDGVAVAGINGSFFQAYTDLQPVGTIIKDGVTEHISNSGSIIAIEENNSVHIDPLYIGIDGGINDQWTWPNNWYSWNINHYYSDPQATMIFNSSYNGAKPDHTFTSIEVDKGLVTKISRGGFNIPTEGFLVLTNDQAMIAKFKVGENAGFKTSFYENDYATSKHNGNALDYSNVRTAVGAGPTLVKNGVIVLDGNKEGFTEDKILNLAAGRSLIGITADGKLGIATVSGVTMSQLAEVAKSLGMVEAMNLDGGASSGLYYNNKYIATPGREVSNAIVIRYLYEDPIRVEVNGQNLFFDAEPYLNKEYNRTLVPLRGIAEALGARVGWDSKTSSILITRSDIELKLQANSKTVYVNGAKEEMEIPVTVRESRSFVPIRFITEYFGGQVNWIGESRTVELTINTISSLLTKADTYYNNQNYEKAIENYLEVLKYDENHIYAIKQLATVYNVKLKEPQQAAQYLKKAYEINPKDDIILGNYAWNQYGIGNIDKGIELFEALTKLLPESPTAYYGIGLSYASYTKQDSVSAIKYFEIALDKGLANDSKDYAQAYMADH